MADFSQGLASAKQCSMPHTKAATVMFTSTTFYGTFFILWFVMNLGMTGVAYYLQIFYSVIQLISVDMMYVFLSQKWAAKMLLHKETMHQTLLTVNFSLGISFWSALYFFIWVSMLKKSIVMQTTKPMCSMWSFTQGTFPKYRNKFTVFISQSHKSILTGKNRNVNINGYWFLSAAGSL